MGRIKKKTPAIKYADRRKNLIRLQPRLDAEIEYRAWKHDGKLRHASFKGLRGVQNNTAIYEIE
ncbi:hypothetical protein AB9F36_23780 [Rhizobium leguminosarum]|uniref:ATP dependent DNA ligase n=1 Tax=Rhizobium leguminosarum TaxID=384 RepID=UPI003F95C296